MFQNYTNMLALLHCNLSLEAQRQEVAFIKAFMEKQIRRNRLDHYAGLICLYAF